MNNTTEQAHELVLEEYRILWDYLKHTMAERKTIYEWYFKVIALPTAIIGVLFGAQTPIPNLPNGFSKPFFMGFLSVIFLASLSLFVSYVLQAANSLQYIEKIQAVKQFISETYGEQYEAVFYAGSANSNLKFALTLSDYKNSPIAIINSGILVFLFNMDHLHALGTNLLIFCAGMLGHIFLSWLFSRRIFLK